METPPPPQVRVRGFSQINKLKKENMHFRENIISCFTKKMCAIYYEL